MSGTRNPLSANKRIDLTDDEMKAFIATQEACVVLRRNPEDILSEMRVNGLLPLFRNPTILDLVCRDLLYDYKITFKYKSAYIYERILIRIYSDYLINAGSISHPDKIPEKHLNSFSHFQHYQKCRIEHGFIIHFAFHCFHENIGSLDLTCSQNRLDAIGQGHLCQDIINRFVKMGLLIQLDHSSQYYFQDKMFLHFLAANYIAACLALVSMGTECSAFSVITGIENQQGNNKRETEYYLDEASAVRKIIQNNYFNPDYKNCMKLVKALLADYRSDSALNECRLSDHIDTNMQIKRLNQRQFIKRMKAIYEKYNSRFDLELADSEVLIIRSSKNTEAPSNELELILGSLSGYLDCYSFGKENVFNTELDQDNHDFNCLTVKSKSHYATKKIHKILQAVFNELYTNTPSRSPTMGIQ